MNMKTILAILINLIFVILCNTGCISTNADYKVPTNFRQSNQEITLPKENANNGKMEKKLQLKLSIKETTCTKSQSCKILLDIQNISNEDVEVGGLLFIMRPYLTGSRTDSSREVSSTVDLDTLENLEPNEDGKHLVIKGNEHFEKEINIEQIKWKNSILSTWEHVNLWEIITEGEYQMDLGVGVFPKEFSAPRKEKIGNVEVTIINPVSNSDRSNYLTLNFKEK